MNDKRIQQLSKQAIDLVNKEHTKLGPDFWIEVYNRKFAELIINECAQVSDKWDPQLPIGDMIKEHFGVEE